MFPAGNLDGELNEDCSSLTQLQVCLINCSLYFSLRWLSSLDGHEHSLAAYAPMHVDWDSHGSMQTQVSASFLFGLNKKKYPKCRNNIFVFCFPDKKCFCILGLWGSHCMFVYKKTNKPISRLVCKQSPTCAVWPDPVVSTLVIF